MALAAQLACSVLIELILHTSAPLIEMTPRRWRASVAASFSVLAPDRRRLAALCRTFIVVEKHHSETMTFLHSGLVVALAIVAIPANGFQLTAPQSPAVATPSRRDVLTNALIFAGALTANQREAQASSRGYHVSRKLKAKEAKMRDSAPHEALPSGVAIQQLQHGRSGFGTFLMHNA